MHDIKRQFIKSLIISQETMNDVREIKEDVYFTYFTNIGTVTGKKIEVESLNSSSETSFLEDLSIRIQNRENISLFQLSKVVIDNLLRSAERYEYNDENTDIKAIMLEDVTIIDFNNRQFNLDNFVLFTDQITGIFPAKIDIK